MQRPILLLVFCHFVIMANAKDLVVLRSGDIIEAIVTEIKKDEVSYKKASNPNGPTYMIDKSGIFTIQYENGEKETFDNVNVLDNTMESRESHYYDNEFVIDSNNQALLSQFNVEYKGSEKLNTNKKNKKTFYSWAMTDSSVLSTSDIEIYFEGDMDFSDTMFGPPGRYEDGEYGDVPFDDNGTYQIRIKNKTVTPVYVDLGNTFRVDNGKPFYYYVGDEQKSIGNGKSAGLSLGMGAVSNALGIGGVAGTLMGGIGLGGSSSYSLATTYIEQRVLVVPPRSYIILSKPKWVKARTEGFFRVDHYTNVGGHFECPPDFNNIELIEPTKQGEQILFKKEDSPYHRDYFITYSKDPSFSSYFTVQISMYVNMLLGTNGKDNGITGFSSDSVAGFVL